MTEALLDVRDLTVRFGGLVAVNHLSFSVAAGEIVGIIGPNGSGKSTTLGAISGAVTPSSGAIRLDGRLLSGAPAYKIARAGIARTFQLVRILPELSVYENVAAGAAFGAQPLWGAALRHKVDAVIRRVGLGEHASAPLETLTYIDQKRLELARALAGDARVLLLDEWLAGLNPTELKTGIALIESLRAEGRTIVLVEHVMDAIRALCDRCVVIAAGAKIAEGPAHAVLSDPAVIQAYLGDDAC